MLKEEWRQLRFHEIAYYAICVWWIASGVISIVSPLSIGDPYLRSIVRIDSGSWMVHAEYGMAFAGIGLGLLFKVRSVQICLVVFSFVIVLLGIVDAAGLGLSFGQSVMIPLLTVAAWVAFAVCQIVLTSRNLRGTPRKKGR